MLSPGHSLSDIVEFQFHTESVTGGLGQLVPIRQLGSCERCSQ
jgi:hypothetical protein